VSREYPARPIVGIGICLLKPDTSGDGHVLLVRRGRAPNIGLWSLPGGAQELGETAEAAARRELREETRLEVGRLVLAANVDSITRDAAGRVQYHYTIIDFAARWNGGRPVAGDDVTDLVWAPLGALGEYALWTEALRVIEVSRGLLGI
jgi:8-oxo-dGTP diphosphatase